LLRSSPNAFCWIVFQMVNVKDRLEFADTGFGLDDGNFLVRGGRYTAGAVEVASVKPHIEWAFMVAGIKWTFLVIMVVRF